MSIYVISDIHGDYNRYIQMLKLINFTDDDELYILGDVIDKGDDGIKILKDLTMRFNVFLLTGNHEYILKEALSGLEHCSIDNFMEQINTEALEKLSYWIAAGGRKTIEGFFALDNDDRQFVLDLLDDADAYKEIEVNGKKFILTHAGINNFDPQKPLHEYRELDFLFNIDLKIRYYNDKTLIIGHIPTIAIDEMYAGKILHATHQNAIYIDAGNAFRTDGGKLACLRLNDMKEFYL